jgi:hypothetical protein
VGAVLKGKYRLDAVLGSGGMAVVYRATHRNRAQFAIKMLHGELSEGRLTDAANALRAGISLEAADVSARLSRYPGQHGKVFARLLEAERLLVHGRTKEAIDALVAARDGSTRWLACGPLGGAYIAAGALADAEKELETCWAQRGAVIAAPINDTVSLYLLPPIRYDLARAKDLLHRPDAADAYRAFLAMEPNAQGDPLEREARRRLGSLQ